MEVIGPFKVCANCAYWGGPRVINPYFKRAEVESWHVSGVCGKFPGWNNCTPNGSPGCIYFEKHPAINL